MAGALSRNRGTGGGGGGILLYPLQNYTFQYQSVGGTSPVCGTVISQLEEICTSHYTYGLQKTKIP